MSNSIKIVLSSLDSASINTSAKLIMSSLRSTGADLVGPVPLPRRRSEYLVNKSPHIDKRSMDKFQIIRYKILIRINNVNSRCMEKLRELNLSGSVDVAITENA